MAAQRELIIADLLQRFAGEQGGLLPLLHAVQEELGCIPADIVPTLAQGMGLSRAEVHGVIGFYHDFRSEAAGETVIHLCRAEACQAMGSRELSAYAESALGVKMNESTEELTLEPVYCLGTCAGSPSVMVDGDTFGRVDHERFDEIVDMMKERD